jgi:hypothetical protein
MLAKFGVPPHLIRVIRRMNTDLQVTFGLNGEPVAVPCTGGVKQGCPSARPPSSSSSRTPPTSTMPARLL